MSANQTVCFKLEQRSVIKFMAANHVKLGEKRGMCTEKHDLVRKHLQMG